MTIIVVLALLGIAYLVAVRVAGRLGEGVENRISRFTDRKIDAYVLRRRQAAAAAGRQGASVGPVRRLKAGSVDAACALAPGIMFGLANGRTTISEYGPGGFDVSTHQGFAFGWFLLVTIIAWVGASWHAAYRNPDNQTLGQRLADYRTVPVAADRALAPKEAFKRHLLRPFAAPGTLLAVVSGNGSTASPPAHDAWTATRPVSGR